MMPPFAVLTLSVLCRQWMAGPPTHELGPEGNEHLLRWHVVRDPAKGNVYVHATLKSDPDPEMHCHPFDNMTIVIDGAVREITPDIERTLLPGDVVMRQAHDRHRLEVDGPAITLFITGPKIRDWGFHDATGLFTPSEEHFAKRALRGAP